MRISRIGTGGGSRQQVSLSGWSFGRRPEGEKRVIMQILREEMSRRRERPLQSLKAGTGLIC